MNPSSIFDLVVGGRFSSNLCVVGKRDFQVTSKSSIDIKHQSRKGIDWQDELMPQDVNTDGNLNFLTLIVSIAQLRTSPWSIPMAKMYIVGTYSSAALKGFVANPAQDRNRLLKQ